MGELLHELHNWKLPCKLKWVRCFINIYWAVHAVDIHIVALAYNNNFLCHQAPEVAAVRWRRLTNASLSLCPSVSAQASGPCTRLSPRGRSGLSRVPWLKRLFLRWSNSVRFHQPQPRVQLTWLLPRSIFLVCRLEVTPGRKCSWRWTSPPAPQYGIFK